MGIATKKIRPHKGFQEKFVRSNVDVVIGGGQLAGGKENPLSTLILTPNGWVRNGDLRVGDKICTPFNGVQEIAGLFPQGKKSIYKLHLMDGRIAECGLEHLWTFRTTKQCTKYNRSDRKDKTKWSYTETTGNLIKRLHRGEKLFLPTNDAVQFEEKELPIHPYAFGVLLGDGCLTESSWRENRQCVFISNSEEDVIKRFSDKINATRIKEPKVGYTLSIYTDEVGKIRKYINDCGLRTYSYNRYIPKEYLFSSVEQRRELLAGLFDTDGGVCDGSFSYSTTSERLKDDIVALCRSLGYNVTWRSDNRLEKYTKGVAYDITIKTSDEIFYSQKHRNRYNEYLKEKGLNYRRSNTHTQIIKIEYDREEDAQCLYINDRDHLYLIDDFVVTHNTFGAVLTIAEPSLDSKFRAVFLRNNLGDLKSGGGVLDGFREAYANGCKIVESGDPHVDFPSGARIDVTHIADQTRKKLEQRFKGRQYDLIYFDELTGFSWECFTFLFSRNRGQASWTGKVRATTNPKRSHWLRTFLDWYIGVDGEIIEEREGVVRYFYIAGEDVKSVVWGDSKEEVYQKCKIQIDRFLKKFNGKNGKATYQDVIKSFTFYLGRTSENKSLGESYASSVAAMGGKKAEENSGNWNIDTDADDLAPIPQDMANQAFLNDEQRNGDRWVTCDLADTGTDNFIAIAWDGLHVLDILILNKTTPRQNAEYLEAFAGQYDVANSHIIYDAIRGTYINDYIDEAIQYVSYRAPMGLYGRMAQRLKDECYLRLAECIKRGEISFDEKLADRIYEHQLLKQDKVTIQNEFIEECSVVRFQDMPSGKKRLFSKREMNQKLGRGRSMDLLDPCAMRMLPLLEYPYGEELQRTTQTDRDYDDDGDYQLGSGSIYDDSTWC